ncbi:hypothetical protein P691DRAFT_778603 [Macrolepiota fuliginosa MF-IS2]|uniref:BTB domain-containing protein n=1 Tax=Macrolepiota fuliginosa MF-IS2 TaxID=1400762 RepID=A0A9P6BY73_9AGAR|nr:hypothetical protein P691DRAFT_778603 [Macrolepiota fuliginosa MF-IS2]
MIHQFPQVTTRDSTYYIEDGNRVFQAGNCLFRVHRYLIERGSPVFKAMLSLEQVVGKNSETLVEGLSDESPIVCEDSAESFRALCWILYASPNEISDAHASDLQRLIALASITHKYEFTDLERWVLKLLCDRVPDDGLMGVSGSVDHLGTLLFIAIQVKYKALVAKVQNIMIAMIGQSQDPLHTLANTIPIAERTTDGEFQAKLFYGYLRATIWKKGSPSRVATSENTAVTEGSIGSDVNHELLKLSSLTENQRLKLYCGYCSLMLLRVRLRQCPQALIVQNLEGTSDWWTSEISRYGDGMYDDPGMLLGEMLTKMGSRSRRSWLETLSPGRPEYAKLKKLKDAFDKGLPNRFMCG